MDLACSLRLLRHWTFQHRPLSPWSFGSAFCCSRHLHTKNVRKLRCCRKIRSQRCVVARFSSTTSTSAHAWCGIVQSFAFGQGHYADFSYIYVIYELNAFMMSFGCKVDETSVFSIQCCQAVWMLMYAFHSYFDCRFVRIVWVSALNDATPFTWRQGSQRMLFHLVWPPPTWREMLQLPLDCTKVFAQGKQSSKHATCCLHSQPHSVAQEQFMKIAARGKTSKAIPAFMATIGLQMCEATLNTACSKIEEVR